MIDAEDTSLPNAYQRHPRSHHVINVQNLYDERVPFYFFRAKMTDLIRTGFDTP